MGMLRTWGIGAGVALALCVTATAAIGQAPAPSYPECTKKPAPADIEGAKGAHKAGQQFYERAEYDKAISQWRIALEFDCTANAVLLNIANAYEKEGDRAATVATLETYLKRTGPDPTLELKVKNLRAAMSTPAPTAQPTVSPTAAPTAVPTAPPPQEGARPFGNIPWYIVGGGGALAIAGVVLLPLGYSNISDAEQRCPNHATCTDQKAVSEGNAGRTKAGIGWGFVSVGVAAVGGAMVWQLLFNKPQAPASKAQGKNVWMAPLAGPGAGGLTVGGQF